MKLFLSLSKIIVQLKSAVVVYSPNVTWEQRLQVYQHALATPMRTVSGSYLWRRWCRQSDAKG